MVFSACISAVHFPPGRPVQLTNRAICMDLVVHALLEQMHLDLSVFAVHLWVGIIAFSGGPFALTT